MGSPNKEAMSSEHPEGGGSRRRPSCPALGSSEALDTVQKIMQDSVNFESNPSGLFLCSHESELLTIDLESDPTATLNPCVFG